MAVAQQAEPRRRSESSDDGHTSFREYLVTAEFFPNIDTPEDAEQAPGIPNIGDALLDPNDVTRRLVRRTSEPLGDQQGFRVICEYRTVTTTGGDALGEDPVSDPSDDQTIVRRSSREVVIELRSDINGDPVVNSAGRQLPRSAQVSRWDPVIEIERTEPIMTASKFTKYNGTTNENAVQTFAAGTLLLTIRTNRVFEAGKERDRVVYELVYREDGWDPELEDVGYMELDGAGGYLVITDADGRDVTEPANLDGNGMALPAGADPMTVGPFAAYRREDFAALDLPKL